MTSVLYPRLFSFSTKSSSMFSMYRKHLNKARQSTLFIQPSKWHTGYIYLQRRYTDCVLDSHQHLQTERGIKQKDEQSGGLWHNDLLGYEHVPTPKHSTTTHAMYTVYKGCVGEVGGWGGGEERLCKCWRTHRWNFFFFCMGFAVHTLSKLGLLKTHFMYLPFGNQG